MGLNIQLGMLSTHRDGFIGVSLCLKNTMCWLLRSSLDTQSPTLWTLKVSQSLSKSLYCIALLLPIPKTFLFLYQLGIDINFS